jgi:hypothetical protein
MGTIYQGRESIVLAIINLLAKLWLRRVSLLMRGLAMRSLGRNLLALVQGISIIT